MIVGLGNPGPRYENTPHNAGFEVVDSLAQRWSAENWRPWKRQAAIAEASACGERILLAKPGTYMNLSGEVVRPLLSYHGLEPEALLIVCDDIALPLGRTRIRGEGSSGGQKGLQSVIDHLGSPEVARLRIGVAPGTEGLPCEADRWVLSKWSPERRTHLGGVIDQAIDCVETWLTEGLQRAMTLHNGRRVPAPGEAIAKDSGESASPEE
jgi:PTH1 family peptidyl-tRNA hydrolase